MFNGHKSFNRGKHTRGKREKPWEVPLRRVARDRFGRAPVMLGGVIVTKAEARQGTSGGGGAYATSSPLERAGAREVSRFGAHLITPVQAAGR